QRRGTEMTTTILRGHGCLIGDDELAAALGQFSVTAALAAERTEPWPLRVLRMVLGPAAGTMLVPAMMAATGKRAGLRFIDFFTANILNNLSRKGWLLPAVLACTLAAPWSAQAGSSYLAVWSSDKETDDISLNTDFLAIIDADPRSPTYGKVVNTARLQHEPGMNLLNDLGFTDALGLTTQYGLPPTGIPSDVLNEAHHMTHDPIVAGGHSYLYLGGLISANVFRCDVTDPLHIPTCPLVTSAKEVEHFSGIDDFTQAPNGNLLVTYMGAKNLTTPGGLVELGLDGTV